MNSSSNILWTPGSDFVNESNLFKYQQWLELKRGLSFDNYDELWTWSVDNVEDFWESLWEYFEIISHSEYSSVKSADTMPRVSWFDGAEINYAEHIFRRKNSGKPALIYCTESGETIELFWNELEEKVSRLRTHLIHSGIKKGDRVAAYIPNNPEAIISFLAVNSIGAVWSCCSPDFGSDTVLDRFSQIQPKILIATDSYQYSGKHIVRSAEVSGISDGISSLEQLIYLGDQSELDTHVPIKTWSEVMSVAPDPIAFEPVDFNHPIWVLYSSGTTGRPKAITHSHGGVLLEHLKYMYFHNDVKSGEHFFWFTTTGWMMWNFLQASMLAGGVPVLFDGSPGFPDLDTLWKLAEDLPIHHFGTSAPYLTACMKKGLSPGKDHDLSKLRSIGSTGAPLPPEAFDWVYNSVSENVWLCSMSGGTDVCTAFVGGIPYKPVIRGHIQGRALGCKLLAFDEDGSEIFNSLGEMVITEPMPSMPVYFWGDHDHQRYTSSYFEKFPGKWCHGDWIKLFEDGSLIIQGRSDATLNRKGIRIGTAEIYSVLNKIEGVKDSLIVNLERDGGNDHMPLFVVLGDGVKLNTLDAIIKRDLSTHCSPRHVPDEVIPVPDIPYTLSGKKMEVPVKKALMGMDLSKSMNKDACRNPEAMNHFIELAKTLTN